MKGGEPPFSYALNQPLISTIIPTTFTYIQKKIDFIGADLFYRNKKNIVV